MFLKILHRQNNSTKACPNFARVRVRTKLPCFVNCTFPEYQRKHVQQIWQKEGRILKRKQIQTTNRQEPIVMPSKTFQEKQCDSHAVCNYLVFSYKLLMIGSMRHGKDIRKELQGSPLILSVKVSPCEKEGNRFSLQHKCFN